MKTLGVYIGILALISFGSANALMCGSQQCPIYKSYGTSWDENSTNHGAPISDDPYTNLYAGMLNDLDQIVVLLGQLVQAENANTAELKKICELGYAPAGGISKC